MFNYVQGLGLYFSNFELNASIYYLAREVGFWAKGSFVVQEIWPWFLLTVIVAIFYFSLRKQSNRWRGILEGMLFLLATYFFVATSVSPYYITVLVAFSVFTKYRFAIVWSLAVIVCYYVNDVDPGKENLLLVGVEYALVYGYLAYELIAGNSQKNISRILV